MDWGFSQLFVRLEGGETARDQHAVSSPSARHQPAINSCNINRWRGEEYEASLLYCTNFLYSFTTFTTQAMSMEPRYLLHTYGTQYTHYIYYPGDEYGADVDLDNMGVDPDAPEAADDDDLFGDSVEEGVASAGADHDDEL